MIAKCSVSLQSRGIFSVTVAHGWMDDGDFDLVEP